MLFGPEIKPHYLRGVLVIVPFLSGKVSNESGKRSAVVPILHQYGFGVSDGILECALLLRPLGPHDERERDRKANKEES